jgi:hypothetical protein
MGLDGVQGPASCPDCSVSLPLQKDRLSYAQFRDIIYESDGINMYLLVK